MELLNLLEDLKSRRDRAKHIFDRENTEEGNKMLKNENWGKFTAYSHSVKHIEIILNYASEVNTCVIPDVSSCANTKNNDYEYCAVCGKKGCSGMHCY